jgi:hypothetical protein
MSIDKSARLQEFDSTIKASNYTHTGIMQRQDIQASLRFLRWLRGGWGWAQTLSPQRSDRKLCGGWN